MPNVSGQCNAFNLFEAGIKPLPRWTEEKDENLNKDNNKGNFGRDWILKSVSAECVRLITAGDNPPSILRHGRRRGSKCVNPRFLNLGTSWR